METNVERIDKSVEHIGIVDNDVLTLGALSSYLAQQFGDEKILWRCTLGKKAAELCSNSQTRPQILLMDMSLSDANGVQICQEIRRTVDDMPILAITSFPLRRYAAAVAQAGVQGIVAKRNLRTIAAALECVVSGHVYLPDELAETMPDLHFELPVQAHRRIVAETLGGQAVKPVLSDRETAIIARYARGQTTLQVGECLGLSENTVKTYTKRAMAKLGAKTRGQAIALWLMQTMTHGV